MKREKVWLEQIAGLNGAHTYGMSSALGATIDDLPTSDSIPSGSMAFDYTTNKVYKFDGVSWH